MYGECLNISNVGWDEGRAAIQAWEDNHVKVSWLFYFPPLDVHSLISSFLCVQLLFFFLAEDNLGVALVTVWVHVFSSPGV